MPRNRIFFFFSLKLFISNNEREIFIVFHNIVLKSHFQCYFGSTVQNYVSFKTRIKCIGTQIFFTTSKSDYTVETTFYFFRRLVGLNKKNMVGGLAAVGLATHNLLKSQGWSGSGGGLNARLATAASVAATTNVLRPPCRTAHKFGFIGRRGAVKIR